MIIQSGCRGYKARNVGNTSDVAFCWSCGHYAKTIDNKRCKCCNGMVKERKLKEYINIMINLDECLQGMKQPEYRFYGKDWVFWATAELLKEFESLKNSDKNDKYYYFIKRIVEDGTLTRVRRL